MQKKSQLLKFVVLLLITELVVLVLLFVPGVDQILDIIELKAIDWRFEHKVDWQNNKKIEDIIIIDIDKRSVKKMGKLLRWSHETHASLIEYLNESGATIIIFDIIFDAQSDDSENSAFLHATKNGENVFHALFFSKEDDSLFHDTMTDLPAGYEGEQNVVLNDVGSCVQFPRFSRIENDYFELLNASLRNGFVNSFPDRDGTVRRSPLFIQFLDGWYPSLVCAAWMHLKGVTDISCENKDPGSLSVTMSTGRKISVPLDRKGRCWINYPGRFGTFRYISYYDVIQKRIPQSFFTDKIIMVGSTLAGAFDLKSTPLQALYPGVEIHASLLYTLLQENFLRQTTFGDELLLILLITFFTAMVAHYTRPILAFFLLIVIEVSFVLLSLLLFSQNNLIVNTTKPMLAGLFVFIILLLYRYFIEEREKRRIKNYFRRYVASEIVENVLSKENGLVLGGEERELTIVFSDIRNFTNMSESQAPSKVVTFLNRYMTIMTEVLKQNKGTLDKYIGDAIVAMFGAPGWRPNHAKQAVNAAVGMLQKVKMLQSEFSDTIFSDFSIGIGINSGKVIVGNMGSEMIFDYTAIGDEMNLASRLEGLTKFYSVPIIISEKTYNQLNDDFICRKLDSVIVKGKKDAVTIFEVLGAANAGDAMQLKMIKESFEHALALYRTMQFQKAKAEFEDFLALLPGDPVAKIYWERCLSYELNPPPADWSGHWKMETK